jgi:hypothetical protein
MADGRLKQIWAGFEGVTSRRLTNRAVDHIVVPSRADWRDDDAAFLPRNFEAPAHVAFEAFKKRLSEKARHAERKDKRALRDSDTKLSEIAYAAPESDAARDLIRALKATEMRTRRMTADYTDALEKPRRGLFGGKPQAQKPTATKASADAGKTKKRFWQL